MEFFSLFGRWILIFAARNREYMSFSWNNRLSASILYPLEFYANLKNKPFKTSKKSSKSYLVIFLRILEYDCIFGMRLIPNDTSDWKLILHYESLWLFEKTLRRYILVFITLIQDSLDETDVGSDHRQLAAIGTYVVSDTDSLVRKVRRRGLITSKELVGLEEFSSYQHSSQLTMQLSGEARSRKDNQQCHACDRNNQVKIVLASAAESLMQFSFNLQYSVSTCCTQEWEIIPEHIYM